MAGQLALLQFPGSLIGALTGWVMGYMWRNEILPQALTSWRIPGWMVGVSPQKHGEGYEGLRRRLQDENVGGAATGADGRIAGDVRPRRTLGRQVLDQFRGTL